MGYNLSDNAFKQVKPILDELVDLSVGNIWKQSFADNYKAARMIRQGFEYCIVNVETVGKRYAELKQNIRIRATNDYVLAERKFSALAPIERVEAVRHKVFEGVTSFNDTLTQILANKHLSTMHFPNFDVTDKLEVLEKVCAGNGFDTFWSNELSPQHKPGLWIIKHGESRDT